MVSHQYIPTTSSRIGKLTVTGASATLTVSASGTASRMSTLIMDLTCPGSSGTNYTVTINGDIYQIDCYVDYGNPVVATITTNGTDECALQCSVMPGCITGTYSDNSGTCVLQAASNTTSVSSSTASIPGSVTVKSIAMTTPNGPSDDNRVKAIVCGSSSC